MILGTSTLDSDVFTGITTEPRGSFTLESRDVSFPGLGVFPGMTFEPDTDTRARSISQTIYLPFVVSSRSVYSLSCSAWSFGGIQPQQFAPQLAVFIERNDELSEYGDRVD